MYSKRRREFSQQRRSSLHVNLSFESSDTSDTDLTTINNKQEILDNNVKKLREAILSKTREIFDNQNDFCKKTATILGNEEDANGQNDQNLSNSQEKRMKLDPIVQESDSNDFLPKPSTSKRKQESKTRKTKTLRTSDSTQHRKSRPPSPIVTSSKSPNSLVFSPRRTRSSSSTKSDTFPGYPITSSTFTSHNSSIPNPAVDGNPRKSDTRKSTKPVIRDVQACCVPLSKIDGYDRLSRGRNLREIPMELTPVVRNPVLRTNFGQNESRTSMEVRTSVDSLLGDSIGRSSAKDLVSNDSVVEVNTKDVVSNDSIGKSNRIDLVSNRSILGSNTKDLISNRSIVKSNTKDLVSKDPIRSIFESNTKYLVPNDLNVESNTVHPVSIDLTSKSIPKKTDQSGLPERTGRRCLSLNKSPKWKATEGREVLEEKSKLDGICERSGGDRLPLNVNTSVGSPRRSTNASVIEATPYPVSRSTFLRTHSRFTSFLEKKSGASGHCVDAANNDPVNPGPSTSRLEDTIVLDASSLKGPIIKDSSESEPESDSKSRIALTDSSDDERSEPDTSASSNKKKSKKRKLFTQLNNSGIISLSPRSVEPTPPPPTPPPKPIRRIRRKNRKILTQKSVMQETLREKSITPEIETEDRMKSAEDRTKSAGDRMRSRRKLQKLEEKEVKKKEVKKKRKVISKKIVLNKQVNPDVLQLLNEVEGLDEEVGPDSLNDFTDNKRIATKGRHHSKCIYIVTTGLCNGDKDLVRAAVRKIGGAKIEASVTRQTTHIITTGVRTINLLRGIIRGCWLVGIRWLKRSVEARTWQRPEGYEIEHFSKAVQENRRDREIFGRSYVPELFATCGLMYIDSRTTPPGEILKELVKTAGGRIIESAQKAKIIVGPKGVREVWVLDSITTGELQPIEEYR